MRHVATYSRATVRRATVRLDDDRVYATGPLVSSRQAEQLIRASLKKATPAWQQWLAPLRQQLAAATSYEEMQAVLAQSGLLDPTEIAEIIHQSKLMGQLLGHAQVAAEVGIGLVPIAEVGQGIAPLPPEKALEWINSKASMPYGDFVLADQRTKALSFSLAGQEQVAVLDAIRGRIAGAMERGETFKTYRDNLHLLYESVGVTERSPWHTETVFRTNVGQSLAAGRWKEMASPVVRELRPFLQYRTVGDYAVRPTHAAMNGRVYRADDPVWRTWAPPSGFNCRCSLVTLNKRALDAKGLTISDEAPQINGQPVEPDEGFAVNPAFLE